jgi:DNA transformation protein
MFGGVGLYSRGVFFGIIARDVLYMKTDDTTRGEYERAGMKPFRPYPDRAGTMQYYAVPVGVLESASELVEWARKAVGVAARANTTVR